MELVRVALNAMATRFEIALHGGEPARLRAAGEEALREVRRLDAQLSYFQPDSDVADINRRAATEAVCLEPRVYALLKRARDLWSATHGAFDITVAPLLRLWGIRGSAGAVPPEEEIVEAMSTVGMSHMELEDECHTVHFDTAGVEIDLGAIGKGYAIERAREILVDLGCQNFLIHGGTSSIYAAGLAIDGERWQVAIRDPLGESGAAITEVSLSNRALSVSAAHGWSFVVGSTRYGHVLDPRSGYPVQGSVLAAVSTDSAMVGDALSTALMVLGPSGFDIVANQEPNVGCLVVSCGVEAAHTTHWSGNW